MVKTSQMNFLSHYFLDRDDKRPHFVVGLVLPDLARNFSKHIRIRQHHTEINFENNFLREINDGVKRHLQVDDIFHNSPFFEKSTQNTLSIIKSKKFDSIHRHQYAFAHVLVEMMLDRILIKNHENLCSEYYTMLELSEEKNIEKYFKSLNFAWTYWDSLLFFLFFKRYKQAQYLRQYTDNESFIFALNRVFSKFLGNDFSKNDRKKLNDCIEEVENDLSVNNSWEEIIKEINAFA